MTRTPDGDDLRHLLDSSFGDGPAPAPAVDRLAPARTALRRRRLGSAVAAAVGVAAAVTAVTLVSGGGGGGGQEVQPAAGPGQVATPAPVPPSGAEDCPDLGEAPPAFPAPADGTAPADLDSLPLDYDPQTGELVVPAPVDGGSATTPGELTCGPVLPAPTPAPELVAPGLDPSQTGRPGESRLVQFAGPETEELIARGDAEILAQTGDVALPDNFAGPGDRTAVARVDAGGTVVYVLARQLGDGRPEYIATVDKRAKWPSIDAFLVHAEKQYAGGAGLR